MNQVKSPLGRHCGLPASQPREAMWGPLSSSVYGHVVGPHTVDGQNPALPIIRNIP